MEYKHIEVIVDALVSVGLEREDILVEQDDFTAQVDLDFTDHAHDELYSNPELWMSVWKVFRNYRASWYFHLC